MPSQEATPETYLGTARAQGWPSAPKSGAHAYGPPATGELHLNEFAYSGSWNVSAQPGRERLRVHVRVADRHTAGSH